MSRLDEFRKLIKDLREDNLVGSTVNNRLYADDFEYLVNEVERLNREVSDLTDACRQWREHAEGKRNY